MDRRVISKIQERLKRDHDAFKRVMQLFGISQQPSLLRNFSSIFQLFPDTPLTMLKDVFEALQLYDLLELLEMKPIKPHTSLQLAYTLDEIKKLYGVADLPTTYHSCGAVLIIRDDENVSSASAIKTFFTDLDNKSDVTELLIQDIPSLRHLKEEINAMILEISARFGETQRETEESLSRCLSGLSSALFHLLKERFRPGERISQEVILRLRQSMDKSMDCISLVRNELNGIKCSSPLEGKTELRQNDEITRFLQSMRVTAERIQENLTQLIKRNLERIVIDEEKEQKNFQENVSAVINRWIHRQG